MSGLYLHIPFCEHKCIYCDFYSLETLDPIGEFLAALHREIDLQKDYGKGTEVGTIFFGGGTPSLLSPDQLANILAHLHEIFAVEPSAEITLEANPGTVDARKLKAYRALGINRISFGVQSFHDDDLRFLTRIHSSLQARENIQRAQEAGFDNVNLDLIFSLPDQTMSRWEENLRQAVDLQTPHISAYSLIVEKGTPLARMVGAKQVSPLPQEIEAEMYERTMQFLASEGYEHYEVSNYAKPGFRSHHNYSYWNHTDYVGFGPSAHSFWKGRRWWNIRSLEGYCAGIAAGKLPVAGEELLTQRELYEEAIMLGLRSDGIDVNRVREEFDVDILREHSSFLDTLRENNMIAVSDERLRLTDKGFLLCDEITATILAGEKILKPIPF